MDPKQLREYLEALCDDLDGLPRRPKRLPATALYVALGMPLLLPGCADETDINHTMYGSPPVDDTAGTGDDTETDCSDDVDNDDDGDFDCDDSDCADDPDCQGDMYRAPPVDP